jgi:hypothetical protein
MTLQELRVHELRIQECTSPIQHVWINFLLIPQKRNDSRITGNPGVIRAEQSSHPNATPESARGYLEHF